MTRKLRVCLDVDGVLADFPTAALKWINYTITYAPEVTDRRSRTLADITQHDLLKAFGLESRQEQFDRWCVDADVCRHLPVYEGAQAFVEELRGIGELVIVTAMYGAVENWAGARLAWLKQHFGIDKRDVIFAKRKECVSGDVLIDDKTKNLVAWENEWPAGMAVAFDQPWNQDWSGNRVRGYAEALESVRSYLEGWNAAAGATT
jgi:5'(3')-deoxyribonucleotidase